MSTGTGMVSFERSFLPCIHSALSRRRRRRWWRRKILKRSPEADNVTFRIVYDVVDPACNKHRNNLFLIFTRVESNSIVSPTHQATVEFRDFATPSPSWDVISGRVSPALKLQTMRFTFSYLLDQLPSVEESHACKRKREEKVLFTFRFSRETNFHELTDIHTCRLHTSRCTGFRRLRSSCTNELNKAQILKDRENRRKVFW